jgi:uncharacterized membrane protein
MTTTAAAHSRLLWLWAVLIVIAGAALRLYDLGGPSLWTDEVFTHIWVRAPLEISMPLVRENGHQTPLYYLLLHAYPTGSDFALRSFSALMGLAGIVGMVWATARLYRSPWLALAAGALLAFNPYHIWLSRTARVYPLVFVLALLASYAFIKLLRGERRSKHWALFVMSTAAGYISHYFMAGLSLAQYIVFGFLLRRKRALFRRWIVAQTIAAIPLMIWIVYMLQAEAVSVGLSWIPKPQPQDVWRTLSTMTVGTASPIPWAVPGLLAALAGLGAGLVYAARHFRAEPEMWYWFWLVVAPLGLVLAVSYLVHPLFVDRYFVVILPALIVLMLRGWTWLAGSRRLYLVAFPTALVCLTGIIITLDTLRVGDHVQEDWRGAAEHVALDFQEGDGILTGSPVELVAFTRYFVQQEFLYAWTDEAGQLIHSPFPEPVTRVWVIVRSYTTSPWVLARRDYVLAEKQFKGLTVLLLDTREEAEQLANTE